MPRHELFTHAVNQAFHAFEEAKHRIDRQLHKEVEKSDISAFCELAENQSFINNHLYKGPWRSCGILFDGPFPVGFQAVNWSPTFSYKIDDVNNWHIDPPFQPTMVLQRLNMRPEELIEIATLFSAEVGVDFHMVDSRKKLEIAEDLVRRVFKFSEPKVIDYRQKVLVEQAEYKLFRTKVDDVLTSQLALYERRKKGK